MAISVAIVEDDKGLREDLAGFINSRRGLRCAGSFASAEDALQSLPDKPPDVVLMDINLSGKSGIECIAALKPRLPDTQFVVLTVFEESEKIFAALRAGASGYLLKRAAPAELAGAIEQVHAGGSPMSPQIARQVVQFFQSQRKAPASAAAANTEDLTARERDLLALLARGKQYKEISDQLGISVDTVRSHIRRIYRKLHVHSRTEAAMKFIGK
ncbi:MAG: response regulator transcription factor [Verrucomicrobia bacterium]|nr:response regulator transcription factor [Verrucomicrobiota bacterium]